MKNTKFLFDVDGTLTEPRSKMTKEHVDMFLSWSNNKSFILVTGSDFGKILDQISSKILSKAEMIFCCLGNEMYQPIDEYNFIKMKNTTIKWPSDVIATCQAFVDGSEHPERAGIHIEKRKGMLNVSSVGRKTTPEYIRSLYVAHGSSCELETQILLTGDLGYIKSELLKKVRKDIEEVERMLKALIKSLENKHLNP